MTPEEVAELEDRAKVAIRAGDWMQAVHALRVLAGRVPGEARVWSNLGRARLRGGDPAAASADFQRVSLLAPQTAAALELPLVQAALDLDDPRWSWLACLKPAGTLATKAMGARLQKFGDARSARELFARAAESDPGDADALVNLAMAEIELGHRDRAAAALSAALTRDPEEPRARFGLGWMRLSRRDWSGYADYDARWRSPDHDARAHLIPAPLWDGGPVAGGRLVLTGQFGVGDEILFAGMVEEAARRAGGDTVMEADARLVALFARSFPGVQVVARQTPPSPAISEGVTAQCATPRLPVLMGPGTPGYTASPSYLAPDPERVAFWRARLAEIGPAPYTGLSWRSGNRRTAGRKSIPLTGLAPLLDAAGGSVVSLQYDPDPQEIAATLGAGCPVPHDNPAADLRGDLDDLAAQIAAFDRIVTISSVTAHLAGALGVPGLVLMQRDPLWFWFTGGETVPWYPSLTVIRQRDEGWDDVVAEAVRRMAANT